MLYPLSYEGGACLDQPGNRARLPILAGGRPGSLAGLVLNSVDTDTDRGFGGPFLPARGETGTAWNGASSQSRTT